MTKAKIVVFVSVLVVGLGAWLILGPPPPEAVGIMASGTVEATESDLGFQVGGRILELAVREGDVVERGAVLARLDASELEARAAAAEAQLAAARALLLELERGPRPEERAHARAVVEAARRRLEDATGTLERTRVLYDGGGASREALDQAEAAFGIAEAQYDQAVRQFELVDRGPRIERIEAQRAAVLQAEAAVRQAEAALSHAVIRAPFAGVVTVRHRQLGEIVPAGAPVLTLMDPDDRWVRIYVAGDEIGHVRIGQVAHIASDTYRDRRYDGRVTFVASEAEFTPRNVQTAKERVRLVYAVKVAITGDPDRDLKPGVPADVVLEPTVP